MHYALCKGQHLFACGGLGHETLGLDNDWRVCGKCAERHLCGVESTVWSGQAFLHNLRRLLVLLLKLVLLQLLW